MTLTTHAIIAATATKPLSGAHPAVIFLVAILSHYLSDAIPHWDYPLDSVQNKENPEKRAWSSKRSLVIKDLVKISFDALVGFAVVFYFTHPASTVECLVAFLAAFGGMLPDGLQGLYMTVKLPIFRFIQRFHDMFHTNIRLGPYPRLGIPFQLLIVVVCLFVI